MYEKYFNGKKVAKGLGSQMYRELDLESYMFRIVNFTNPSTDFGSLPRLLDIYKLIDMKNILRLKSTDDSIQLSKSVCEIVFGIIDSVQQPEEGNSDGQDDNENSENDENRESNGSSDGGGSKG